MTGRNRDRIVVSFKRNDFILLLDALEWTIEDYKYTTGLERADEFVRLENRLRKRLQSHDSRGSRV